MQGIRKKAEITFSGYMWEGTGGLEPPAFRTLFSRLRSYVGSITSRCFGK